MFSKIEPNQFPIPAVTAAPLFGSSCPAVTGPTFGSPRPAVSGTFNFGSPRPAVSGTFNFGSPRPAVSGTFNFGSPRPAVSGTFNFGSPCPADSGTSLIQTSFEGSTTFSKQKTTSVNVETKVGIELKCLEELSKDLQQALEPESSYLADVTLKCGDASIPAHKIILSVRSPVFSRMFASPMKESLKNEVDITDIDESVLRELLKFMYSGKISDFTVSSAADLLSAADKYQLLDLKSVCSFFLKNAVSTENVWKVLVLGDMYSSDLKSFAVNYISNNFGDFKVIEAMQEYKSLRKEKRDLALELVESLVKHRDGKRKR